MKQEITTYKTPQGILNLHETYGKYGTITEFFTNSNIMWVKTTEGEFKAKEILG